MNSEKEATQPAAQDGWKLVPEAVLMRLKQIHDSCEGVSYSYRRSEAQTQWELLAAAPASPSAATIKENLRVGAGVEDAQDERGALRDESAQFETWFATKKEHAHGWSPRYAAIEGWQARAASTSANVAQGAEAVDIGLDLSVPYPSDEMLRLFGWENRDGGGLPRERAISRYNCVASWVLDAALAAPPAQPSLADDARAAAQPDAPSIAAHAGAATDTHQTVIGALIDLTRAVFHAMDDSEEREGADGREHVIDSVNFDAVSNALDVLEALPDDKPGYTLGAAGKAEWALRALLAAAPTPVADSGDEPVAELVQWVNFSNRACFDIKVFDKTLKNGTKFYTRAAAKPVSAAAAKEGALTDDERNAIEVALSWVPHRGCPEVHEVLREFLNRTTTASADAEELSLRELYEDACIAANKNAEDADRWRYMANHAVIVDGSVEGMISITIASAADSGACEIAAERAIDAARKGASTDADEKKPREQRG